MGLPWNATGRRNTTAYTQLLHGRGRRFQGSAGALCIIAIALLLLAPPAFAAIINADNGAVTVDPGDGECSLPEAISAANDDSSTMTAPTDGECEAGSGADEIRLVQSDPSQILLFSLAQVHDNTDGANGLPSVTSEITIAGNEGTVTRRLSLPPTTVVPPFRLFHVAASGNLTLNDLRVSNGSSESSGGAIYNRGVLTLNRSAVVDSDTTVNGGGIANRGSTDSMVNINMLTINNSTISGNVAGEPTGTDRRGGGIHNSSGNMLIADSTISGNSAPTNGFALNDGEGGGLFTTHGFNDEVEIRNSTISDNFSFGRAGAIFSESGLLRIVHSTITENHSESPTRGVFVDVPAGSSRSTDPVEFRASIIAGNSVESSDFDIANMGADATIGIDSLGSNLVGQRSGSLGNPFTEAGDMTVGDPLLGALAMNGGPTRTHEPQGNSPAVDAVQGACPPPEADQRGVTRPANGGSGGGCDIGAVERQVFDYGDAPAEYPVTRADDGAAHAGGGGLRLGNAFDADDDGQPSADADGDDNDAGGDDEDGVILPVLFAGESASIAVSSGSGSINAWVDFNGDGDWTDAGEQIATDFPALPMGAPTFVPVTTPMDAVPGVTYARFRLSGAGGDAPTGVADNGEVEDYSVTIRGFDFGDAPTAAQSGFAQSYPTREADNGAVHILGGADSPILNELVDAETDGLPTENADGDDNNGTMNPNPGLVGDEDGIVSLVEGSQVAGFPNTPLPTGSELTLATVVTNGEGVLNGWIDFNRDGDWNDAGEQVVSNRQLPLQEAVQFTVSVPIGASTGDTYARFRVSSAGIATPFGQADDGEVEDYRLSIVDGDSDGDGIPNAYETENGLDPNNPEDADDDLDMDGVANIEEFNNGISADEPDSDQDGIGDNLDAHPATASNDCVPDGLGDAQFDFTAMSGMLTQCAAENSVTVLDASNAVIEAGAQLQLFSRAVSFEPGATVPMGAEVQAVIGDPTPGMAP